MKVAVSAETGRGQRWVTGTLNAGKTYVPLDPGYPRACNEYMLANSAAHIGLTDHDIAGQAHRAVVTSAMADAVIARINRAAHGAAVGLPPQAPVPARIRR